MESDRDNQIVCFWMKMHWILCSHLWTFYSILRNRNRSSNINHNLQSSLLKQSRPPDPAFGMPHCCSNPNRSCDRLCQDCLWGRNTYLVWYWLFGAKEITIFSTPVFDTARFLDTNVTRPAPGLGNFPGIFIHTNIQIRFRTCPSAFTCTALNHLGSSTFISVDSVNNLVCIAWATQIYSRKRIRTCGRKLAVCNQMVASWVVGFDPNRPKVGRCARLHTHTHTYTHTHTNKHMRKYIRKYSHKKCRRQGIFTYNN